MKVLEKTLIRGGSGSVKMVAEEGDDLWLACNLISAGDRVLAATDRKVANLRDGSRATRSKADSRVVQLELEVKVEAIDYFGGGGGGVVRLRGRNMIQNNHVAVGQYHTLEIGVMRPFVISKRLWDAAALELLSKACERRSAARETDRTEETTDEGKAKKKMMTKKKKKGEGETGEGGEKTAEEKALKDFERLERNQPGKTCYGIEEVYLAAEWKAVATLLVAERLFRNADPATRRRYAALVDAVRASKGAVLVYGAAPGRPHGALEKYAGVAAVLRLPLPAARDP